MVVYFAACGDALADLIIARPLAGTTSSTRLLNVELTRLHRYLIVSLPAPHGASRDLCLDLRRVTLEPPPSAVVVHLRSITAAVIDSDVFWTPVDASCVKIQVSSSEVATVIEDAFAASGHEDRKKRCHIIQS